MHQQDDSPLKSQMMQICEMLIEVQQMNKVAADFPYKNSYDFVLKNGTQRLWSPHKMKMGQPQQCFMNSASACMADPSLTYCEGYILVHIPILHAWCLDREGRVVDLTIDDSPQLEYFGVSFKTSYVEDRIFKTERWLSVIDNHLERYPLLTGQHTPLEWMP